LIYLVDKDNLFRIFNIDNLSLLSQAIDSTAPSMVDYYLFDLIKGLEPTSLNKFNVETTINIDSFTVYNDYDSNIYIEVLNSNDEFETKSFW
jgi:hypothetical protein